MSDQENTVRQANKRGTARLGAVQALYQMDVGGTSLNSVLEEFELYRLGKEIDEELYLPADVAYFRQLVKGVVAEQRTLDPMIHAALEKGWPLARIDQTMRAIMRCGLFELMSRKDIPIAIVLSEYIDVAKAFFEGDEPRMVNGVLDALARQIRPEEARQRVPKIQDASEDGSQEARSEEKRPENKQDEEDQT
jgi:transcription antitermination protein NusB